MNKALFISYTRADAARLPGLLKGLQKLKNRPWLDQELDGGQDWWDEVLAQIREADAVVLCLTPSVLESTACRREWEYALSLGKPILPVMLQSVSADLLPPEIASVQVIDFTETNEDAAFDLVAALERLPTAGALPDPLPDPPDVPVSYLSALGSKIQSSSLSIDEQYAIIGQLRGGLHRPKERQAAQQLMDRLRSRDDLYAGPGRELEELFHESAGDDKSGPVAMKPPPPPIVAPAAPPSYAPPAPAKKGGAAKVIGAVLASLLALVVVIVLNTGDDQTPTDYVVDDTTPSRPYGIASPTSEPKSSAPIGDECLVGEWVSTEIDGTLSVDGETVAISGGRGTTLSIDRDGSAVTDFGPSQEFTLTASDGTRLGLELDGTSTSRVRGSGDGSLHETIQSEKVTGVFIADDERTEPFAQTGTPWTDYNCSSATLTLSDSNQRMSFKRQ